LRVVLVRMRIGLAFRIQLRVLEKVWVWC
jgi:hypothetical protein